MKFYITILAILLCFILVACGGSKPEKDDSMPDEKFSPEELPNEFLEGNFETIYNQTSESFQDMVSFEEFEELGKDFNQGLNEFVLASTMPFQNVTEYQWISVEGDKGIQGHFADDFTIEGLRLTPVISNLESDNIYTEVTYQMPMKGEWFTFWGGTNELVNYHYATENQRYAYDLVIEKDGSTFEGDHKNNESYYAFGEDVLAPADGTVVSVENDIKDNTPTVETNAKEPLGNHVILEHDHHEYSVIAHLQQGSLKVNEGDQVRAGDLLGFVGNSGNSSEPHIHFHVVDGPEWEEATSIRIKLENGKDPIRGETVNGFE
ncbi:M23 family metallopeptidase [Piscibacillus halophilus]|uniref:Peptidase family M23 n=1 Tax=Piscibacillus halophilus TaxID=571933 RepID=A0A1H8ZJN8_9BACI|nr:M23 family metallopeptidase [Piscibacillus halophilus]SEP64574.1 Peptidase family M23 [Piscibacillus halophilus]